LSGFVKGNFSRDVEIIGPKGFLDVFFQVKKQASESRELRGERVAGSCLD
jgi:hypothetical protein